MHEIFNVKHLVFVGLCSDHFLIFFFFFFLGHAFELHGFYVFVHIFGGTSVSIFGVFTLLVMLQF